jgi:signal transduction histidine kinase
MPNVEEQVADANTGASVGQASLLEAFARFQQHCERLDTVHAELRQRLAQAELRLEEKNRELASRVREIGFMKQRLSAIIDAIPDPLLVVGPDARIELANAAAHQVFPEALAGTELTGGAPELAGVGTGKTMAAAEIVLPREQGELTLVSASSPLANAEDAADSRVLVLKNVTEYRRLQERLARENRLAALGQVAANVAHEIRNPLAAIEGFGRLLEQDLTESRPASVRLVARMLFAANQMNCVVSNLLNYARESTISLAPGTLATLVQEVMDMMELKAVECGVETTLTTDSSRGACMLDAPRMKEVVVNLVANAIQACPPRSGGHLDLSVRTSRGTVELVVADTGRGIPDEALARIFEPFYTLKDDGIGLGLALCKRIVEEHEGTIVAENRPGGGALFRVRIPLRATPTQVPEAHHD